MRMPIKELSTGTVTMEFKDVDWSNVRKIMPDTLVVNMTRIDEIRANHPTIKRVDLRVDGESHEFDADELVAALKKLVGR